MGANMLRTAISVGVNMIKRLIAKILLCVLVLTGHLDAQTSLNEMPPVSKEAKPSIGLGVGFLNYYGDVNSIGNHNSLTNQFGYEVHVARKINDYSDLGFSFLTGTILGNERSANRNLNFKTQIYSVGLYATYNLDYLLNFSKVLNPYVTIGFESFEYNNKGDLVDANGAPYHYWDDGTIRSLDQSSPLAYQASLMQRDYQYETDLRSENLDDFGKYAQLAIGVPIGLGFNLNVSDRLSFKFNTTFHYTFTDLIDNLSKNGEGNRKGNGMNDYFTYNSVSVHYDLLSSPPNTNPEAFYFPDYFMLDMADQDGDGIVDGLDICPFTPKGVKVDDEGCPLDDDNDGVPNYLDNESATLDASFVSAKGKTLTDADYYNQYLRYIDSAPIPLDVLYKIAGEPEKSAQYRILLGEFSGRLPEDLARKFVEEGDVIGTLNTDNNTAYLTRKYLSLNDAKRRKSELLDKGFPQATIVIWEKSEYFTLKEWEEKSKKDLKVRFKEHYENKEQLEGLYAVKLGETEADAQTVDKTKFFEYEDVVVLDGDTSKKDYVIGPFIDKVGAKQLLADVDREKFPNAKIVKVRNGKAIEIGVQVSDVVANSTPEGAKAWNKDRKKPEQEKENILAKLNGNLVIDFGKANDPKTNTVLNKIKSEKDVVEVKDENGDVRIITKNPQSESFIRKEVDRLNTQNIPAKVVRVEDGALEPVSVEELKEAENKNIVSNSLVKEQHEKKENILSKLEDAFVIDFGKVSDSKTQAVKEKLKSEQDLVEVTTSKGETKLITKTPLTKEEAETLLKEIKTQEIKGSPAVVKDGNIIPVKLGDELKQQEKELRKMETQSAINYGQIESKEEKESFDKLKGTGDFKEVIDEYGNKSLVSKNETAELEVTKEVEKLQANAINVSKAQVIGGKVVSVENENSENKSAGLLSKLNGNLVIDFGKANDPKTLAIKEKIKAKQAVVEVTTADGNTKLITKNPQSEIQTEKALKELKSDNILATAAVVKDGNLIPIKIGEELIQQKKELVKLENNVAVNYDKIETQAEKESFENLTSSGDFIEVIDDEGDKWLVAKNNDGNKQAVTEVDELASENVTIGKVSNGKVVPTKNQPTKNSLSDGVLSKLENAFVIDFGKTDDPKTQAAKKKIKSVQDVVEVTTKTGESKLISKKPQSKSEVEKTLSELKTENIKAKVVLVKNGLLIPVKIGEELAQQKEELKQLDNNVAIAYGKLETKEEKTSYETLKESGFFVEVLDEEGNKSLVAKNEKGNEIALAEIEKLQALNISVKEAKVQEGDVLPTKASKPMKKPEELITKTDGEAITIPNNVQEEVLTNPVLEKHEDKFLVKLGTIDESTPLIDVNKLLNAPNTFQVKKSDGTIDVLSNNSSKLEEPSHSDKAAFKKQGFENAKVAFVREGKATVLKKENLDGKFSLSLGSFKSDVPSEAVNKIASIPDVESMETFNPNLTTYAVGNFNSANEAQERLEELIVKGFKPELIKYQDGKVKVIDIVSVFDKLTLQRLTALSDETKLIKTDEVVFRVQLGAYRGKIKESVFKGVQTLSFPNSGGITKYVTGSFGTYQQAYIHKLTMKNMGFAGAFVVAYKDGKRIKVTDLVNQEKFEQVKRLASPIEQEYRKVEEEIIQTKATLNSETATPKVSYRVQIGAYKDGEEPSELSQFPNVEMEIYGQYKRYLSGDFPTYSQANDHKSEVKGKGFDGAFVVAYSNGQRVSAAGENPNVISKNDLSSAASSATTPAKYQKSKLLIMVQIGLYRGDIPEDLKGKFQSLPNLTKQVTTHGVIRYMTGNFKNLSEAAAFKEELVKKGFDGAFLVAYYDNERIKVEEAVEILKEAR